MTDLNLANSAILTESGVFVSENMVRLNEILQDYDPYLELHWIPPKDRVAADNTPPYRIIHCPPGKQAYVVMHITEVEANNPQEILARLFAGDNWGKNVLADLEYRDTAAKAFMLKQHAEQMEESHDKFHFLFNTSRSKNYVNWVDRNGNKVKLNEYRRPV